MKFKLRPSFSNVVSENDYFFFYKENKLQLARAVVMFGALAETLYTLKHLFFDNDYQSMVIPLRIGTAVLMFGVYFFLLYYDKITRKQFEIISFGVSLLFVGSLIVGAIPFNNRFSIDTSLLMGLPAVILFGGLILRKSILLIIAIWAIYLTVLFNYIDLSYIETVSSIILITIITSSTLLAKSILEEGEIARLEMSITVRNQKQIYEQLTESSLDLVCQLSPSGEIGFVSDSVSSLLGYSKSEVLYSNFIDLIHPDDRKLIKTRVQIPALRGASSKEECRLRLKNGSYKWFELLTNPSIESGKVLRIHTYSRNIDDQKRVSLSNLAKQRKLDSVFANSYDITFIMDLDFNFQFISDSIYPILGYKAKATYGKRVQQIFTPESVTKLKDHFRYIKNADPHTVLNVPIMLELELYSRNNDLIQCESMMRAVLDEEGETVIIGTGRDVTSNKQTMHNLRLSEERLKELNKQKDQFFAIISHDLRSPFNNLHQLTGFLESKVDKLSKTEIMNLVKYLNVSSLATKNLLDNLLQWSRSHISNTKLNYNSFNFIDILNEISQVLDSQLQNKNITLKVNVLPVNVTGDQVMISTVLRNLISNAIKFTHEGGAITVNTHSHSHHLKLEVIDTGVGFTEEQIQKLLTHHQAWSTAGTNREPGSGLGLQICKDILKKHESTLVISNNKEEGTTCSFLLPIRFEEEIPA